jgi:SAM-dependent methyltransferase
MSNLEIELIKELLAKGLIASPILELGVSYDVDFNTKDELTRLGLQYYGTDMHAGKDVDYVINFENDFDIIQQQYPQLPAFKTILILNVLEHTYNPIKVLQNALRMLDSGGILITATPTVFPIHNYPIDVYRLLPDFYTEFARHEKISMVPDYFRFMGYGPIADYTRDGLISYPKPWRNSLQEWRSRITHKLFNTVGRGMTNPNHLSISAVFRK